MFKHVIPTVLLSLLAQEDLFKFDFIAT